jgi:hypothetical protein
MMGYSDLNTRNQKEVEQKMKTNIHLHGKGMKSAPNVHFVYD